MPHRAFVLLALAFATCSVVARQPPPSLVCSYAPSQSNVVAAISGAAGSRSAVAGAVAGATGLTVIAHGSGALLLTGSSGYLVDSSSRAAVAVPVVVGVGIVVGGAIVTLELVCAPERQRAQVAKVMLAAEEFSRRFARAMEHTTIAAGEDRQHVTELPTDSALRVKHVSPDVWAYANRPSVAASNRRGF